MSTHTYFTKRNRLGGILLGVLAISILFGSQAQAQAAQAELAVDRDVTIWQRDISATAVFYPFQIGNRRSEVFAVKAPDNTIRVVVNACQTCGPAGYFQEGDNFVCSACMQKFHVTHLEKRQGGCNPLPVGDANKKVGPDRIVLGRDFLKKVTDSKFGKGA